MAFTRTAEAPSQSWKSESVVLPEGDYVVTVREAQETCSKRGDDQIAMTLQIEADGQHGIAFERLTDTENAWPICDAFAFASGLVAKPGQQYDLTARTVSGRRAWAHIVQEEQTMGKRAGEQINRVKYWITNKEVPAPAKAARVAAAPPVQAAATDADAKADEFPF